MYENRPEYRAIPHLEKRIIHRADDAFPFLHDTVIAALGGRLFAAWYNCSRDEIEGRTVIRGRWSADGGGSWSEAEIVAEDMREHRHMVPATFLEDGGVTQAYVTRMSAHDRPLGYVTYRYDGSRWRETERIDVPVLFNTLPLQASGRLYIGGRMAEAPGGPPLVPIVAVREPGQAHWRILRLPGPWQSGAYPLRFPETALLADGDRLEAVVRNDDGPFWQYSSEDGGESWSPPAPCPLSVVPAKVCMGTLPDARQYLIFNEPAGGWRTRLVLSVRNDRFSPFDARYVLADGFDEALQAGPDWHYPCACVAGGRMHVSCTASGAGVRCHAALFSFSPADL